MTAKHPPVVWLLVLGGGVLSISTAAIFIRFAQAEAPSLVIAAGRMLAATLPLMIYALLKERAALKMMRGRDLKLSILAGVFLAIHFAAWISSLEFTSIASSVVIVCTTPVWVTLADVVFFKGKIKPGTIAGIAVTLGGGMLVGLSDSCVISSTGIHCQAAAAASGSRAAVGNLLALVGSWMAAAYLVIGRVVRQQVSLPVYTVVVYGTAAIGLCLGVALARLPVGGYSPSVYGFIVLLAIFPQLIGHTSLNWALKYLPVTYVTIANMGEPIGSTLFAILLFKEIPTPLKVLGSVIILCGIYIVTRSGLRTGDQLPG
jgi:drug/metabolite transporter (DMT)-like permease